MTAITSPQNTNFKRWMSLLDSRGIKKQGQFLLMGRKTVPEALKSHAGLFVELLIPETSSIPEWAHKMSLAQYTLPAPLFNELDIYGTHSPMAVGNIAEIPVADLSLKPSGLEVLCAVGEPSNLGAMIRNCAAFGVSRLVLLKEAANPFHPKSLRAASGSIFSLELATGPSISELSSQLTALDMHGQPLPNYQWEVNTRLLLGEEGPGLPSNHTFNKVAVPMAPGVESLNVAAATAVALYSYRLQHPLNLKNTE